MPFLRFKDSFFLDEASGERAREVLLGLVEEQLDAMGPNNNEAQQNNEQGDAEPAQGSSILSSLRKRIRLTRERHMEVGILVLTQLLKNFHLKDTGSSAQSTIEAYLRLPLEEHKCLRFAL